MVRARDLEQQPVLTNLLEEAGHRDRLAGVDARQVLHADLVAHRRVALRQEVFDGSVGGLLHQHDHRGCGEHAIAPDVSGHQDFVHDSLQASFETWRQRAEIDHAVHCVE